MRLVVEAACGCCTGIIREKNEDNFYFAGTCLAPENDGLAQPVLFRGSPKKGEIFAIFDGMGGERYGEVAAYAAASSLQTARRLRWFASMHTYLTGLVGQLNKAVTRAQESHRTRRMGTTIAAICFAGRHLYACNLGDSRVYRLRGGELLQLSRDHAEIRPHSDCRKAPLTRFLGMDTDAALVQPHILQMRPRKKDIYLLCSDGLTDMLTADRICDILSSKPNPQDCASALLQAASEQGGWDNITAIVCRII